MVRNGRSNDLKLIRNGVSVTLSELKAKFYEELELTAKALDEYSEGYLKAFNSEMNADFIPSEKIMSEIKSQNLSFQDYGLAQSKNIAQEHSSTSNQDFSELIGAAETSLKDLKNLQENAGMDINKYVELYNSKI